MRGKADSLAPGGAAVRSRIWVIERYISLWQPWATLWALGEKGLETRGWPTKHRGPLGIHAARKVDNDAFFAEPFRSRLRAHGYEHPLDLARGAIVGAVDISGCLEMISGDYCGHQKDDDREICLRCDPRLTEQERAFGIYEPGRHAWDSDDRMECEPVYMRALQRIQRLPAPLALVPKAGQRQPAASETSEETA